MLSGTPDSTPDSAVESAGWLANPIASPRGASGARPQRTESADRNTERLEKPMLRTTKSIIDGLGVRLPDRRVTTAEDC